MSKKLKTVLMIVIPLVVVFGTVFCYGWFVYTTEPMVSRFRYPSPNQDSQISEITIYNSSVVEDGYGVRYKVNLDKKRLYRAYSVGESYGYRCIRKLDLEKIEVFRETAEVMKAMNEYYDGYNYDNHLWYIVINYTDSTSIQLSACRNYPESYNVIFDAFHELTGESILLMKQEGLQDATS